MKLFLYAVLIAFLIAKAFCVYLFLGFCKAYRKYHRMKGGKQ